MLTTLLLSFEHTSLHFTQLLFTKLVDTSLPHI